MNNVNVNGLKELGGKRDLDAGKPAGSSNMSVSPKVAVHLRVAKTAETPTNYFYGRPADAQGTVNPAMDAKKG